MSSKKMSERAVVLSFGFVVGALVSMMPACAEPNPIIASTTAETSIARTSIRIGRMRIARTIRVWQKSRMTDASRSWDEPPTAVPPRPSVLNLGCSTDAPPAHPRSTSMRASTPGLRARRSRPRDQGLDETPPSTNGGEELSALSNSVRGPQFRPVLVCKDLLTALVDEFERLHAVCPPRSVRVPGRRRRYGIIPACPVERSSGSASVFLLP